MAKAAAKKKRPAPTALAVRHVAFEDLGSLAAVLRGRGFKIGYRDAGRHDLRAVDALKPDLLVVLGGPIGTYEENTYPFLRDEFRLIEKRLAAKRPIIGICLGAQLMAWVLGARVYPGPRKEIGWGPLKLTAEGARSCLKHLSPDQTRVLHWHGDTFDLPQGAMPLASTDVCANQAFSLGKHALALQFHAEVAAKNIERWLIGHACEIAAAPGVSAEDLRAQTRRFAPALEAQGPKCFGAWLDGAGLKSHVSPKTKR
ncbi:MAG TPA: glutamine amidotransferase [Alphaproteobacteria bacterium]|jgi:GMP synthase (glutamine-hydrolysing)|nr:glutamine amidotransferase [Alphaproteobacteria bacterium]